MPKSRITINNFLLLICILLPEIPYAQTKLSSLTGEGRPVIKNPDSLATALRKVCEKKVAAHLGKKYFKSFYIKDYLYPHYYKNVYYNTAEAERGYRVFFKFRPVGQTDYDFEIPISSDGKTVLQALSSFLPDCKKTPTECNCAHEKQVMEIGNAMENNLFKNPGHTKFSYDAKLGTFIWTYWKSERLSSTKGHHLSVVFDANDLSIISRTLDTNVWMGRCLGKGTLISLAAGMKPVEDLKPGDTLLSKNIYGQVQEYQVREISKRPVSASFRMIQYKENGTIIAQISPAHPDENGNPAGMSINHNSAFSLSSKDYQEDYTYDILSTAPDGGYFCGQLYLRSTLSAKTDY